MDAEPTKEELAALIVRLMDFATTSAKFLQLTERERAVYGWSLDKIFPECKEPVGA